MAIETSCDDSCVALLDRYSKDEPPILVHHLKSTLDSKSVGGIVPTKAFVHHQENLASLVRQMCNSYDLYTQPPDLICVTQGPGMPGSLNIGLDTAKGLSVAWNKPLVGVHHMLLHLLVPRMVSNGLKPSFPFYSLLVSGGHTMLVRSDSLLSHQVVCDTIDIAAGDLLDKCGRTLGFRGNMIAKEMDMFIIENHQPIDSSIDLTSINKPLMNKPGRKDVQSFSFSLFNGMVERTLQKNNLKLDTLTPLQRYTISSYIQETIFQHMIDKISISLDSTAHSQFVISGGVSANQTLRSKFEQNFPKFEFFYPDLQFCTDNAVMIGWTGIEMYEQLHYTSELDITPIRKWPLADLVL